MRSRCTTNPCRWARARALAWWRAGGCLAFAAFVPLLFSAPAACADTGAVLAGNCVAARGWWVDPSGRVVILVESGRISGRLDPAPANAACGSITLREQVIGAPACTWDQTDSCVSSVHIVFVTPDFAIVTARRFAAGTCTETCVLWDAATIRPSNTPVSPAAWGYVKKLFQ